MIKIHMPYEAKYQLLINKQEITSLKRMDKKQFLLCKKLFGRINYHQLLNEYVLHNFFAFLSNIINCQEQLKTIQQTEKKKKCTSFLGVCIISSVALCDTISK